MPEASMDAMANGLRRWELLGILLIFFSGTLLHFVFEWCGRLTVIAPFVAVNESVWEHLKLAFWPAVFYALLEYRFIGRRVANFPIAKGLGIFLMPFLIVVLFYAYTALLTSALEKFGEGCLPRIEHGTAIDHVEILPVAACVHTGSAWHADGGLHIHVIEHNALIGEAVQVRRADNGITHVAEGIPS